jgi:transcriptional regulator with XRE-family HTH domain
MNPRSPSPIDQKVGQAIRAYRLTAGMSQVELAAQIGVTFQQVQKYEKGLNRVGAGRLSEIAEILDIPLSQFFEPAKSPRAQESAAVQLGFLTDRNAVRLMTAYSDIADRGIRQALADLVENIAKWASPAATRRKSK